MGTFLLLCVLGLVAFVVVGAILSAVLHALVWLVTLPFRIFFKLLFGLGGILAGLVLAPFIAVIALIALVVSVDRRRVGDARAAAAGAAPGWLRLGHLPPRVAETRAAPPPPAGFWS